MRPSADPSTELGTSPSTGLAAGASDELVTSPSTGLGTGPSPRRRTGASSAWTTLQASIRSARGRFGLGVALAIFVVALAAPVISPTRPAAIDLNAELQPPSFHHPLGTGENGLDVLTHVIYGARVSLWVSLFAVGISAIVGILLGGIAGYVGGIVDEGLMRAVDILLAFPGILLAIFITAVMGPSLTNVIFALAITGWTGYARLVRSQVLTLRERDYVLAAQALGAGHARILARHLLPNAAGPLIVQVTFGIPAAILAEASLSFLGLGAPPGTPSWGSLVDQGTQYLLLAPHIALFPGLAIALTVLGFNFLGDGLRDAIDPKAEQATRF